MEGQRRTTGIPAIDAAVKEFLKLPRREQRKRDQPLDEKFPGTKITRELNSEIMAVGAGWEFPFYAIAFVAAGARITAYEMNPAKFGRGQIGRTMKDDILNFFPACRLAHLMPDFTKEHLERLPNEIRDIMNLQCHQKLRKKLLAIISKGREAYKNLPDAEKMSKKEVLDTKQSILDYMKKAGLLKVEYREVTSDMVEYWLEQKKPVYLMTGSQLKIEKLGLNHLIGNPRFLKEFLLETEETDNFIKSVLNLQQNHASRNTSENLPRLGIVGGGASALTCELDLCKVLKDNLEIISIAAEKRLKLHESLESAVKHRFIYGYVSKLLLDEKKNVVKSVEITGFPGRDVQYFDSSLFIHIHNQSTPSGRWGTPFQSAMESITKLLDKKSPKNGFVRDAAIGPNSQIREISLRITEPWYLNLKDDKELVEIIQFLANQNPEKTTIIATGKNIMVDCLLSLTASLGYQGHFIQVVVPIQDPREISLREQIESEGKFQRRQIQGRLKNVKLNGKKFTLEIQNSEEKTVPDVPDVDFLLNATGKTTRTYLIDGLVRNRLLRQKDRSTGKLGFESNHPLLAGYPTIFEGDWIETETDRPGYWLEPYYPEPRTEPLWWKEAFDTARNLLEKSRG